jgi:23S rRNA pseudouridine1911/1915/1917 synthase
MIKNNDSNKMLIEISKENEGLRIKEYLIQNHSFSSRLLSRLKKRNAILLNGRAVSVTKNIFRGDVLEIIFEKEKLNYEPIEMPLDILYEDGDILVLNKPPFLVVHPTKTHLSNTLANGIAFYFQNNNIHKKIRFVNRLDMDTSGIIIIAKNSYAHQFVQKQMEDQSIQKKYNALIEGQFPFDEGTINLPVGKENKGDIKRKVFNEGKNALTKFKKIDDFGKNGALLEVELITGRTHQIRVHFNHYNNPLVGDSLYGEPSKLINRHALHSTYLKLKVPRKKEPVEIYSKLPEDIIQLIKQLRVDYNG